VPRPTPPPSAPPSSPPSLPPSSPGGQTVEIDLGKLKFDAQHINLFLSSAYFRPKTSAGMNVYFDEFPDHYAARINVAEWEGISSKSVEDYVRRLQGRAEFVKRLAATHKKLIIHLSLMPQWLSASSDGKVVEGYLHEYNFHSPRDFATWERMMAETARFFAQFPVERYYEVWNEPDLHFWREGTEEYLKLYEATARAVKGADPKGKVGGSAINGWDKRPARATAGDNLNAELIRFCAARGVPLDFVSWHQFNTDPMGYVKARQSYEREVRAAGLKPEPEYVVTEWHIPGAARGTDMAAALFANQYIGLVAAGIDAQTVSTWENFRADPDPEGYGLVTQSGVKKPVFYVHRFFDAFARGAEGIAFINTNSPNALEGARCVFVARKPGGVVELVLWEIGNSPPLAAAMAYLSKNGMGKGDFDRYGSAGNLEARIRDGQAIDGKHTRLFAEAQRIYRAHPDRGGAVRITFPGASRVQPLSAEAVRNAPRNPETRAEGNSVTVALDKYEVLRLAVRLD
jgi:hypothetical protein